MDLNNIFKANISYIETAKEVKIKPKIKNDFNALFDDENIELNDNEVNDVLSIINKYFFIAKTRQSSESWKNIFKYMHQICNETFLVSNSWDKSWLSKMANSYPIERVSFTWDKLIERVNEIMSYVAERYDSGFWYPRSVGNKKRCNLYDFFCSQMKNGKCWSPFLELHCRDCISLSMLEEMAGESIRTTCDKIIWDGTWWSVNYDSRCSMIKGALDLYKWYDENRDKLLNYTNNKIQIASFVGLLGIIEQWHRQTKGCPPSFITPNATQWGAFQFWAKNMRDVVV